MANYFYLKNVAVINDPLSLSGTTAPNGINDAGQILFRCQRQNTRLSLQFRNLHDNQLPQPTERVPGHAYHRDQRHRSTCRLFRSNERYN